MTIVILLVQIFRAKKKIDSPTKFHGGAAARAFFYNPEILVDGQELTGTPGASRTHSVAGGHRASALRTVRRVPLVPPLPASPAVPSRVQLSSAEMGVLAAQQMFAYM